MCRPTIGQVNKTDVFFVDKLSEVPDLARASLSLGLFMAQEEVKPVKEGHGDLTGSPKSEKASWVSKKRSRYSRMTATGMYDII